MNHLITIYPNPASHSINIKLSEKISENNNFEIVNHVGSIIYNRQNLVPSITYTINLSTFPKGVYFALVKSKGNTLTKKILLD